MPLSGIPLGRGDHSFIAERARCPRCVRLLRRVEHVRPATGRHRRLSGPHWACLCGRCRSSAIVLQPLELHLKLLIPVLQLLDGTGELAQCAFHGRAEPEDLINTALPPAPPGAGAARRG